MELKILLTQKNLPLKKELAITEKIKKSAISWAIAEASVQEIDQINILNASLLAMKRATQQLSVAPNLILVDGNKLLTTNIHLAK